MVSLEVFKDIHKDALCSYRLPETQKCFTAMPEATFERIATRNLAGDFLATPVSIMYNARPSGFFVLDAGNDKLAYTHNPDSLLLRALSIDQTLQGKGIGTQAMLLVPDFVRRNYKKGQYSEIVLGVNLDNAVAYKVYLKVGYEDRGKQMEGPSGMQHVLTLTL